MYILNQIMNPVISEARPDVSQYAPKIVQIKIDPKKIGDVVGKQGKTINKIIDEFGVTIDIEEDGSVNVAGLDRAQIDKAVQTIKNIVTEIEEGQIFTGKVVRILEFGAFVNLTPGTDGLLHISQIRNLANGERIDAVEDVLKEGDTVEVIVQGVDDRGKISLAIPGFEDQESSAPRREHGDRSDRDDRRGGRGRRDDRRSDRDDRDYDDRPRRRRSDRDDRDYDDRPRRRRERDYDDRDDRDYDDRPRRRRSDRDDRDYDRDDRRSDRRGGRGRRDDRNPRYAADENYDEYRADREERSERPRRRIRRDFDPFED